jgi:hypothetical protein
MQQMLLEDETNFQQVVFQIEVELCDFGGTGDM